MKRYDLEYVSTAAYVGDNELVEREDGDWIQWDDHQQALAAERERVTELEAQCAGWKGREALTYDELIDQRDAANTRADAADDRAMKYACSTDNLRYDNERAERAVAALSRIAYLLERPTQHGGLGEAANAALDVARGES